MKTRKTRFIIIAAIALGLPSAASAQRTAYGERQVTLEGHFSPAPSYGASVSFGQYLLAGYWEGGLVLDNYVKAHESGLMFGNARVEGYGAFMYRIFGTRDRRLSIYGGGDVFLGFEFLDPFRQLTDPVWNSMLNDGYAAHRFIYGASPRAACEFFLTRNLALVAGCRIPVTLGGQFRTDLVGFSFGLGARYNF